MKENFVCDHYELSPLTMLITPQFDDFGNIYSKVIEEERDLIVKQNPLEIIEDACKYFGSDLRGRQIATDAITGYSYKSPIAIEPYNQIYFFPTASPTSTTCTWLSHAHILRIYPTDEEQSKIVFVNGTNYLLDVTEHSLTNQLLRTAQLRCSIESRINYPKNNFHYPLLPYVADPKRHFRPFS